jgi:5'-nucleotidase
MKLIALVAAALLASSCAADKPIRVKLAAFNDFHGNLRSPAEGQPMPDGTTARAGGAAQIAAKLTELRSQHEHFASVFAGDLLGASPMLSMMLDDEPTVEAMNLAGLDFGSVGNHELDYGIEHLRRLQDGGCPKEGCKSGKAFGGARFGWLAANVIERATGRPVLPPYAVRQFGPVKMAFIGVTTIDTATLIPRRAAEPLEFRDEAATANGLVPELKAQGIEAIALLIHEGGAAGGGPNACENPRGKILGIVERLDPAIDLVVSGHTHRSYVCRFGGRLVTSAGSYGRLLTEIDVEIDPATRDVVRTSAVNHVVLAEGRSDPAVAALVERYSKLGSPTLDKPAGRIAASFWRTPSAAGETAMGNLVADSQLAASADQGAQIAFMNPGGIRASLVHKGDGSLTFADIFEVYPFTNTLVTMTLSGAQIVRLLEQQWQEAQGDVLQVSRGFSYTWNPALPPGKRVTGVKLNGEPLRAEANYRVTANSYIAGGGNGFRVFLEGRDRVTGPMHARDALIRWLEAEPPRAPATKPRIETVSK